MVYIYNMLLKRTIYSLLISALISCSSSKINSSVRKQERKDIESLLLVRSLPVRISAKDSLFRRDIQILLHDRLKAKKFECLNREDANDLSKKYYENLFGVNNKQRILDNIENIKKDKEYFLKEVEFARPYMQSVEISACSTESANCIIAKRVNYPNGRKQKSWEFKYDETESINHLVSRIIDSLTSH
jgi:hypothetical protein